MYFTQPYGDVIAVDELKYIQTDWIHFNSGRIAERRSSAIAATLLRTRSRSISYSSSPGVLCTQHGSLARLTT